jgi:isopentenyl diphosphate isomerase/L-lactate dehydrogenase-like FMN-dependent dehydrogenase
MGGKIVELDINEQDPEDMDLTDVVLEYDDIVSSISVLEKRREELRTRILNTLKEKDINVLRVGDVELRRQKVEWKLWRIHKLKSYLMKKDLWDMVESVDRKTLSRLIEKGILTEEELKGTYDVETRYSLHVSRSE